MILAAGRGSRLRPLTDSTPKPLLKVGERSLIEHHLQNLASAGITEIVINLAYLGDQIKAALGNGEKYGLNIQYSEELEGGLETGGGIFKALPLLGKDPFIVINSDFYSDYSFENLPLSPKGLSHLVLIDKPDDVDVGDFAFQDGQLHAEGFKNLYFSGIGVYRTELFADCKPGVFSLTPLLRQAIEEGKVTAEHYQGRWHEIGTPERWEKLQQLIAKS